MNRLQGRLFSQRENLGECTRIDFTELPLSPIKFDFSLIFDKEGRVTDIRSESNQETAAYKTTRQCMESHLDDAFREEGAGRGVAKVPIKIYLIAAVNNIAVHTYNSAPPHCQGSETCEPLASGDFCSPEEIRRSIRNVAEYFDPCLKEYLANNSYANNHITWIHANFRLHPELDQPYQIAITQIGTPQDGDLIQCLSDSFLSVDFERPQGGECRINYPFVIGPKKPHSLMEIIVTR